MNIAIVHHHLNRGGVTRVILNHLRALSDSATASEELSVVVLHGGRTAGWPDEVAFANLDLRVAVVDGLDYDTETSAADHLPENLAAALHAAGFDPTNTVLHVHNHSLGKNLAMPSALRRVREDGFGLLLHVHDFAEDQRPANYARLQEAFGPDVGETLYPAGPRVHYAVLNRRDHEVFRTAGTTASRLHFLPNPVVPVETAVDRQSARARLYDRFDIPHERPYLLQPVRGIRRKNVGEAVLVAALLADRGTVGMTLAPINPAEQPRYETWKAFTATHGIPMQFGTGEAGGLGFEENLAAADGVLLTSVAEGFGMAFLEPWTAGLPVGGRDLPEITGDFAADGLRLEGRVYERLPIPLDWIDIDAYRARFHEAARNVVNTYGRQVDESDVDEALSCKLADDRVDFGDLDELLQERVVERVANDPSARDELLASVPALSRILESDAGLIAENRRVVLDHYSPAACGRKLRTIYDSVLAEETAAETVSLPRPDAILEAFLDLDRIRLLRC